MNDKLSSIRSLPGLVLGGFIFIGAVSPTFCLADKDRENNSSNPVIQKKTIEGVAVTGSNNLFQHAIWDIGPPLSTAFFNWTFAHNPSGSTPFLLTADMPGNTVIANGLDPNARAVGLGPDPATVNPLLINTPLHKTPVTTDLDNFGRGRGIGVRLQLPTTLEAATGAAATRGVPNEPITKARWYKAKGKMEIKCFVDGTAKAEIKLSNLIPNGVYTMWTIHEVVINGSPNIAPYPFGGVPNVLVPDEDGRASTTRKFGYCPLTEQNLIFVDVAFHSDGNAYGSVPDQPYDSVPQAMGSVTHTHVEFPIHVVGLAP